MTIDRSELRRLIKEASCEVFLRDYSPHPHEERNAEIQAARSKLAKIARTALPALLDALDAAEAQLLDTTWQDHADHWQKRAVAAEAQLEKVRIQLAACGVIAMSNTPDSAKNARTMHPDYDCASIRDVSDAVDREMAAREAWKAAEAREWRLMEHVTALVEVVERSVDTRTCSAGILRALNGARKALAETAP